MLSCIIIAPTNLLPQADAFAAAVGLPTGQFTVDYEEGYMLCHFPPSEVALATLKGDLPDWLQVINTDIDTTERDLDKVVVFLSFQEDGWVHKATVDGWPTNA